jgi:L-fucose isomerase-like protein
MANTTRVTDKTLILTHCTAAFNLVSDIKLETHYETDSSLAVNGTLNTGNVTVFRLSGSLDKAFIAEGKVAGHPALVNACRTQTEIELPARALALLKENPLGNHLLLAPGKYAELLRMACFYKSISML